jgi:hypothetical protein
MPANELKFDTGPIKFDTGPTRSPARIAFSSTYAYGLVAFFALLFRSPDLFRHPRFWAEEATLYVSAAWNSGIGVMLAVFNGNYQFLVNLSAYFASLVPYRFAPYVTTYISLAAIILVSVVFSVALSRRKISPWLVFIFVVTLSLLPGGYEIYLNVTNLQWVVALSFLAILAMPGEHINPRLAHPWAIACGLTGVPTCILSPVFLVYGFVARSNRHFAIGATLSACACIQVLIIALHGTSGRNFALNPDILSLSFFLNTIETPLLGPVLSEKLASLFRSGASHTAVPVSVFFASAAIIVGMAMLPDDKRLSLTISGSWIFVTCIQFFGALGQISQISGAFSAGARYFQYGACCFCLLACLGASSANTLRRTISTFLLMAALSSAVLSALNNSWAAVLLNGPRWSESIATCVELPCSVSIWPSGWKVVLP